MGVRLNEDEIWDFLDAAHTGIFTSVRGDGVPIALPTWFVTMDRAVYLQTPAKAKKVARVRADDRASFLVESGLAWRELKAVLLVGRAELVDDEDLAGDVLRRVSEKYEDFRMKSEAMPEASQRHYAGTNAVITIRPEDRVLSWDNAKLFEGER